MATATTTTETATATAEAVTPDHVVSLRVVERPLDLYLALVGGCAEGQPRLKCGPGRITLVSPKRPHEKGRTRLAMLVVQICEVLETPVDPYGSTLYPIPGTGQGYMPDEAFLIEDFEAGGADSKGDDDPRPDLVIEIVVTHPEHDALAACAALRVPEVWVYHIPRKRLVFYRLVTRGKDKGKYVPLLKSRMLGGLKPEEALALLNEGPRNMVAFGAHCRDFARRVLLPRRQAGGK